MLLRARLFGIGVAALAAIPLTVLGPAGFSQAAVKAAPAKTAPATASSCATAKPGYAACKALIRTDIVSTQAISPNATPSGLGPSSLDAAYALPSSTAGSSRTVAIVDAYDDPTAEADLGVYRSQFGLSACTTANGCFKKIN